MIYGENNYSKLVNLAEQKIEIIMGLEDEGRKRFGQEYEIKSYKGDVQNYQAVDKYLEERLRYFEEGHLRADN